MLIRTGCEHPELSERARNSRSIPQGCERRRHQNDDEGTAAKRQVEMNSAIESDGGGGWGGGRGVRVPRDGRECEKA